MNKKLNVISIIFLIFLIFLIIILILVSIKLIQTNRFPFINYHNKKMDENLTPSFTLRSYESNKVLLNFNNVIGFDKIECPNGDIIYCNGKTSVGIDYSVEANNTYNFIVTDMENNQKTESFITPKTHIEISKKDIIIDIQQMKEDISLGLNENLIATNFVNIGVGDQNYVDSQSTDMQTVFNSWTSFGDGVWTYTSDGTVHNSKNTNCFTGYYKPGEVYDDIELTFNAKTDNSDDDMIGAIIRFNKNSDTSYSSYLFLLDGHDYNGGVNSGENNGLNKIINKNLQSLAWNIKDNAVKLNVNSSLKWTRAKWQNYKIIARGDKLEAYIDNILVASATDSSIARGSYGFVCLSQPDTSFKDIVIKTNKTKNFGELLSSITWEVNDINVVINLNNTNEASLSSQSCIDSFNNNDIYYIGISSESNKDSIEQFIQKINNKGIWTDSTTYNTYVGNVVSYLSSILQ